MKSILIFVLFILVGCYGPRVEHIKINKSDLKAVSDSMSIMSKTEIADRNYKVLSPLTATSCKNKAWDASPTNEDATLQLKIKAKSMDADALINLICEAPRGTSVDTNCWSSIACHATAIKFEKK